MSATKPISPGDWVFWYGGLFKVLTVEDVDTKRYPENKYWTQFSGKVATLEPLNVATHVQSWYNHEVKYHGGVRFHRLTRVNPLSAEKRGYLKRVLT